MGGVVSMNGSAIGLWKKLRVSMVGTLTKAFRHKRLGYINAYVMYQLLQDSDHWPTADDAPDGWRVIRMLLHASGSGYLAATI
jgi:hypothetical protein